jgi:hypothetical protein
MDGILGRDSSSIRMLELRRSYTIWGDSLSLGRYLA